VSVSGNIRHWLVMGCGLHDRCATAVWGKSQKPQTLSSGKAEDLSSDYCELYPQKESGQHVRLTYPFKARWLLRGGAGKSLARPGRKQATAAKLGIYSTSPRSSIHYFARWSNFCMSLKKNSKDCPSNQVSAAAMPSVSDEKWRPFNFFTVQGTDGSPTGPDQ
jgi:hypothetical protein